MGVDTAQPPVKPVQPDERDPKPKPASAKPDRPTTDERPPDDTKPVVRFG